VTFEDLYLEAIVEEVAVTIVPANTEPNNAGEMVGKITPKGMNSPMSSTFSTANIPVNAANFVCKIFTLKVRSLPKLLHIMHAKYEGMNSDEQRFFNGKYAGKLCEFCLEDTENLTFRSLSHILHEMTPSTFRRQLAVQFTTNPNFADEQHFFNARNLEFYVVDILQRKFSRLLEITGLFGRISSLL